MKNRILLALFFALLSSTAFPQYDVTGIFTDYNTFWRSSTTSINTIKPERSHNLLAFTWNGVTFSTGVNDARLTSNSVTFSPKDFRAFPIDAVAAASGTYIGLGQLQDGVNNGGSVPPPFTYPAGPAVLASFLTDGPKGLDLGTGIANIAAGQMRFNLSSLGISSSAINDGVPDVVVTQIAAPSTTNLDSIYFIDVNGALVGNRLPINHNNVSISGKWMPDFYNTSGTINIINSERDIRLWAADLTSFGITSVNVSNAVALIYKLNGQSDVAFVAFNVPSISVATKLGLVTPPSSTVNPACCGNTGSSPISQQPVVQVQDASGNNILQSGILVTASITSGPAGYGALSGTTTVSTNSSGQAIFSNLVMPCETGNYTIQFTSSNLEPVSSGTISVTKLQYYVRPGSTGNLSGLSSWSTALDGTGANPDNFNAGKEFILNNNSGDVAFATGGNWTVNGKLIIPAGKTLTITSNTTTTLRCDIGQTGTIESGSSSTLILNGSSLQTLGGTSNLKNLTINNSAGVSLSGNTSVANSMTLTSGTVTLNAVSLTLNGAISRTSGTLNASLASSAVIFSGSSLQQIPSGAFTGNIRNLTINNAAGVNMNSDITVTNILTLSSGNIILNNNNLSVGSISGGGASSYVQTNGNGRITATVNGGGGQLNFPVGNSSYNPVRITNNNVAADQFAVRVLDEMYVNSTSGTVMPQHRIRRSWNIQKSGGNTGSGISFLFNWDAAQNNGVVAPALYAYESGWIKQTAGVSSSPTATSFSYTGYTGGAYYFGMLDNAAILPVTWKSFDATLRNDDVYLDWQTATEQYTLEFIIERSNDMNNWTRIGLVEAAGNSSSVKQYRFTDRSPLPGNNYYRLKQVDTDGKFVYSGVRMIRFSGNTGIEVLGNPVTGKHLLMRVSEAEHIALYDGKGIMIWNKKFTSGVHSVDVSCLSAGIYLLKSLYSTKQIIIQ